MQQPLDKIPIADLAPHFISDEFMQVFSPVQLHRIDARGLRYYYRMQDDEPKFYISGTSFSRKVLPTSPYLVDWKASLGKEESEIVAQRAAQYGTFMHVLFGDFLKDGQIEESLSDRLFQYCLDNSIPEFYHSKWIGELENDLLSFAQWCFDLNVKPIAIEFPIFSDDMCIATMIDLVCEHDIEVEGHFGEVYKSGPRKGEPKTSKETRRVKSIVDFKSGRKGFYEAHELQLHTNLKMWNDWYGGTAFEAHRVFNWSPKDWITTPGYNYKDQTGSALAETLPFHVQIMKKQGFHIPSKAFTFITGKLVLGESTEGKYEKRNLFNIITQKHKENAFR